MVMKLIAWRNDGTPKKQQLWEEWMKIRTGRQPLTTKEWAWAVGVGLVVFTLTLLLMRALA